MTERHRSLNIVKGTVIKRNDRPGSDVAEIAFDTCTGTVFKITDINEEEGYVK